MIQTAVMPAPHLPVELREAAEPELESGSVLLRTIASEVCGTDVHLWHGKLAGVPYPLIPGHVSIGEVIATGGEIKDIEGKVGQSVEPEFTKIRDLCFSCYKAATKVYFDKTFRRNEVK